MRREVHVRFCESLGVRSLRATHPSEGRGWRTGRAVNVPATLKIPIGGEQTAQICVNAGFNS
jgi:hypothetical protein